MKGKRSYFLMTICTAISFMLGAGALAAEESGKIVHDAEYYILEAQNSDKWAAEDKDLEKSGGSVGFHWQDP